MNSKGHVLNPFKQSKGYLQVEIKGKNMLIHRIVYETLALKGEKIPKGFDIHHVNGIKTDNSLANLQMVEHCKHAADHANTLQSNGNNSVRVDPNGVNANQNQMKEIIFIDDTSESEDLLLTYLDG